MARGRIRRAIRRRLQGILPTIGMLLIASAIFRLGEGATAALAEATESPAPGHETHAEPDAYADVPELIRALKAREAALEEREKALLARLKAAEVAEASIRDKLAKLQAAEASLLEKITIAETGTQEDVDQLTQVYAQMKPKNAAALFSQMDPSFAAGFLARMNPEAAAAILAGMTPETAYTISVVLAGRNANQFEN